MSSSSPERSVRQGSSGYLGGIDVWGSLDEKNSIWEIFVISVLNIELWMNLKCDDRKNPLHPGLWLRLFPKSVLKMTMSSSNTTCFNSDEGTCPSKPPRDILSYTLLYRCPPRDQARSCLLRIISSFSLWLIIILCCSRLVINYFIFNLHPEIGQQRPCDPCQAMPWGQRLKKTKLCLCISKKQSANRGVISKTKTV